MRSHFNKYSPREVRNAIDSSGLTYPLWSVVIVTSDSTGWVMLNTTTSTTQWLKGDANKLWFMGWIWLLPASIDNILLEHSHAHLFTYYLWLSLHYNGRVELSMTKTISPTKPKMLSFPFQKKFGDLCL